VTHRLRAVSWWLGVFIACHLTLGASQSSADFNLKSYLELRESPQVQAQLKDYFTGVGRGIFWTNAWLRARNAPRLFCMPDALALDEGIIQSILDQEIRDARRSYKSDTPVEFILVMGFANKFPCPS